MMDVGLRESVSPLPAQRLPEERTAGLENADPPLQRNADAEFKLTKCVTIKANGGDKPSDRPNPSDKWLRYLYVSSGHAQCLSELPDNGHVLLHIDIPNQQVYPLPLLITPVNCIYLITFDLPEGKEEEKKVLKTIRNTLKDVYTYLNCLCDKPGFGAELYSVKKVFLVGLQREVKDRSSFAQQLKQMLGTRSYERLIVRTKKNDLYWANLGAELSIHENPALLSKIQRYSCQPTQLIRQSLAFHCELLRRFKDDPLILYEEVEAKGADGVSGIMEGPNLEKFLEVLHCFGFIFYCSLPELAQSEKVVVLQPQYLRQLFVQVQEQSKETKWFTTADLLATAGKHIRDKQKWFQAMCTSRGLVIERSISVSPDYVFVMGLEQECDLPERAHYSVDPLLVTYRPPGFEEKADDCLLPSPLFPAFVTAFLKKLKERNKKQRDPIAMKRHYLHVSVNGSTRIHVVERDSFIEIGLQQFHVGVPVPDKVQQLDRLQQSCQDTKDIVSNSAECATACLRLDSSSLRYGCLCDCENGELGDRFGEFDREDGTLTCSCCDEPKDPTPQQQIWFNNVDHLKVVVQPVAIPGNKREIRKLEAGSVPALQPQQSQTQLESSVDDRPDHAKLFRIHVSRNAAGKGKAVLEGVGLDAATIAACFTANPQNHEEAVQDGLTIWKGGQGTQPPTWGVLTGAMEYAQIEQQSVQGLKKELGLLV